MVLFILIYVLIIVARCFDGWFCADGGLSSRLSCFIVIWRWLKTAHQWTGGWVVTSLSILSNYD